MNYTIPQRIEQMTPYEPITGEYELRLDANESYRSLSEDQLSRIVEGLRTLSYNRYPDPYAVKLCRAFGDLYGIDPKFVTAGNGSDELIALLCGTFFTDRDTVAVFSQDFSMYRVYCETYGVACKVIPKREDLTIDVDAALEFIQREKITALIFSNPCNPTSIGLKAEEVRRLVSRTDALVILDEAYMDFWDQSLLSEVERYENLIILKTCSKAIGLAGIRLGFLIANEKITKLVRAVKSPYNVNLMTQLYGEAVLSDREGVRSAAKELIQSKWDLEEKIRSLAREFPEEIPAVYPSDTNFVFLRAKHGKEIFESLLTESIAIRYMGDYLRISTGSKEENQRLYQALSKILSQLSQKGGEQK